MIDAPAAGPPSAVAGGLPSPRTVRRVVVGIDALWLMVLAVAAAVPRMTNLLGLDPFVDEAAWMDWVLRQFAWTEPETWLVSVFKDGRPPLFVWIAAPFGMVVDNGMLAGRLASALAGVASTLALYALGRDLASRTVGVTAGLLWAVSPYSVFFARVAVDDATLALTSILATWASVRLARRPSLPVGAVCGLALGATVLAKTSGVLLAAAPPLALLFLGSLSAWREHLRSLVVTGLVGFLTIAPLMLGLAQLMDQIALHTPSPQTQKAGALLANLDLVTYWAGVYLGQPFVVAVGVGAVLALVWRQRGLLFVLCLSLVMTLAMLRISTSLFPRYVLFTVFPAYLLAGYALDRAAFGVGALVARVRRLSPGVGASVHGVVAAAALILIVAPRFGLLAEIVRDPARAAIPETEHFRYVEQWYAVYGLGQVVQELRLRAAERPITVVVPPASRESRVIVPHAALRQYVRHDTNIRIVEAPALWRAQELVEVRRIARDGPTYLVVNGSHTDAPGMPNDVPAYTQRLERRLAQDVPNAREVLRIPRPSAPNWLVLYRLDGGN